jgi:hypothetical protein
MAMRHADLFGVLAMLAALGSATAALAAPEPLTGERFLDVMSNNTLSGTTASGASFDIYFLDGGGVTYEDSAGERDHGRWLMEPDGAVCITWQGTSGQRCYKAFVDGDRLSWQGADGSGAATLRGGVGTGSLKPR